MKKLIPCIAFIAVIAGLVAGLFISARTAELKAPSGEYVKVKTGASLNRRIKTDGNTFTVTEKKKDLVEGIFIDEQAYKNYQKDFESFLEKEKNGIGFSVELGGKTQQIRLVRISKKTYAVLSSYKSKKTFEKAMDKLTYKVSKD